MLLGNDIEPTQALSGVFDLYQTRRTFDKDALTPYKELWKKQKTLLKAATHAPELTR